MMNAPDGTMTASATLDPVEAARCRRGLLGRVERWRSELSTLQVAIIATGPRARVSLSRDLEALIAGCDRLTRTVDQLATATDGIAWQAIRGQAEEEWADLVYRTRRLRQRIRRSRQFRQRSNRSHGDPPAASTGRGAAEGAAAAAVSVGARARDPLPAEESTAALIEAPTFRWKRLRLWSAILGRWATLVESEEVRLAAVRYRLIADLERRDGARPNRSGRSRWSGRSIAADPPEAFPGTFVFAGHSHVTW